MWIFFNLFMHKIYSESTVLSNSGITPHLTSSARPPISVLYLKFDQDINLIEIWHISEFHTLKILCGLGLFTLLFLLFLSLNSKLYVSKCENRRKGVKKNNIMFSLLLVTILKLISIGIIILASYNKINSTLKPHKTISRDYFLSPEYFIDVYQKMDQQTGGLQNWHAISKMKLKGYKSFFQILILLSGDVALNPGPTQYPCSFCGKGVGAGSVKCSLCDKWIHSKCEGLSRSQVIALSRASNLNYTCRVCKDSQMVSMSPVYQSPCYSPLPLHVFPASPTSQASSLSLNSLASPISLATHNSPVSPVSLSSPASLVSQNSPASQASLTTQASLSSPASLTFPSSPIAPDSMALEPLATQLPLENDPLPFSESSLSVNDDEHFHIQDEHLHNVSLEDESIIFKKKGLHFAHLNCNSLLSKIDEIRQFSLDFKPHVLCLSETKIDSSVTHAEVEIDGYSIIRRDRNRHGGGVDCYVNNSIHYNERDDFKGDLKIFL